MELEKKYGVFFFLIGYILLVLVYNLYLKGFGTEQAEYRIQQTLLNIKAYAKFISEEQKPVIYKLKQKGILDKEYFHPALLSTNYIAQVANRYYNEELKSQNLNEGMFRQTSTNLLNSDNRVNEFECILKRFFEPLCTIGRLFEGSGLGTHVHYNLVTQSLHGEISPASQAGEGLEIIITIPLQEKNNV